MQAGLEVVQGLSSPLSRRLGIWGASYNLPEAIFCLLKGGYRVIEFRRGLSLIGL